LQEKETERGWGGGRISERFTKKKTREGKLARAGKGNTKGYGWGQKKV